MRDEVLNIYIRAVNVFLYAMCSVLVFALFRSAVAEAASVNSSRQKLLKGKKKRASPVLFLASSFFTDAAATVATLFFTTHPSQAVTVRTSSTQW